MLVVNASCRKPSSLITTGKMNGYAERSKRDLKHAFNSDLKHMKLGQSHTALENNEILLKCRGVSDFNYR